MRYVYRTSFELRPKDTAQDVFAAFSELVWCWIFHREGIGSRVRPTEAKGTAMLASFKCGKHFEIESLHVEAPGQRAWAASIRHTEPHDDRMLWVSELAVSRDPKGKYFFSFSQLVGRQDGGVVPLLRTPGRPRIIRTLLNEFEVYSGGLRLLDKPFQVRANESDADGFVRILTSRDRNLPAVLISIHEQSNQPLVNARDLADRLSGLAQVFVAETVGVSLSITKRLPPWLTCFDGAIRIYWPGFTRLSQASEHRLWTAQHLSEEVGFDSSRFADKLLAMIAEVSVFSMPPSFMSWQQIQGLDRRRIIEAAKEQQDWRALAEELDKDSQSKDAEIKALKEELRQSNDALFKERQLVATYRQVIEDKKTGSSNATEGQLPIETVAEAILRAEKQYSNELVFALNSQSQPDSPFDQPTEAFLAFEWLVTIYRESRLGRLKCTDFDVHIASILSGWHYSGHQKDATMKANESWYRCTWNGAKHWIPEHLKCGRSRDAQESIRIAFAWHTESQKVIVGFIGQHQKGTKT